MAGVVERLQFLLTMDSSGAIKGFKNIGSVASQELGRAQSSMDKVAHSMNRVGGGSLAIAGVMGRALFNVASGFQNSAITAGVFSDATRLSMEQSSRWVEVAGDMGISSSDLQTAFTKMEKSLATSPEKFKQLGIEVARTSAGTVDAEGTFLNLVDRLNSMPDPAMRAKAAADILGRGWQANAELISKGSDQIRASLAGVSSSQVFSSEDRRKAEQFRKAMEDLSDAGEELRNNLARGAVPVISQLANVTSTAVGAFARLDDVSNGSLGAFTAIATTGLGAAGAMALIAGQAMKAKDNLIKFDQAAQKNVLTGIGKLTVGFAALSVALTVGTMAWSAITAKKREAAARTAEVSAALATEVMNLIREKNAIDASRVGFEALSTALTTTGKDGDKLTIALATLGKTTADAAPTLLGLSGTAEDAHKTLFSLANGVTLTSEEASYLADGISKLGADFVNFDETLGSRRLSGRFLEIAQAMIELQAQSKKTRLFQDMTDAIWKMAGSGEAGQKALKKINETLKGNDNATVAKRYELLSQALYGMDDAANAAAGGIGEVKKVVEQVSAPTAEGRAKLAEYARTSNIAAQAADRLASDVEAVTKAITDSNAAISNAVDIEAAYRSAIVDSREDLKLLKEELREAGKDQKLVNAIVSEHVNTQYDDAEAIAEGRLATMDYITEQDKSAAKSLLQAEALRQVVKQVGKDSPLGKGLLEVIALLEDIPDDIRIRIYAQMTGNLPYNPMTSPNLTGIKPPPKKKIKRRAMGGPVVAGEQYVVGEEGPELLTMGSSAGAITPNSGLAASSTTININVTAPLGQDPYAFGQVVVSALKTYVRTNGKISGVAA